MQKVLNSICEEINMDENCVKEINLFYKFDIHT